MALRAPLPVKLYYRIGEVAEVVGVEPHVLRYWESEFGTIRPQKSPKGQRVYSRRDLEKLLRVKELLYSEGYTIAGAKKRLRDLSVETAPTQEDPARAQAERFRSELLELRDALRAELLTLEETTFDFSTDDVSG